MVLEVFFAMRAKYFEAQRIPMPSGMFSAELFSTRRNL